MGSYNSSAKVAGRATEVSGTGFELIFSGNPGSLPDPKIETRTNGYQPTITASKDGAEQAKLVTKVFSDGDLANDNDFFGDHCDGVTVKIDTTNNRLDTTSITADELKRLKACLGDANGDDSDNKEVYNWDYGSDDFPHLIKLVRTVSSYQDGGSIVPIKYLTSPDRFDMLIPFAPKDGLTNDEYEVFTTKGVLQRVSDDAEVYANFGSNVLYTYNPDRYVKATSKYVDSTKGNTEDFDGDVSCEGNEGEVDACVSPGSYVTYFAPGTPAANSPQLNLYEVGSIAKKQVHYYNRDVIDSYATPSSDSAFDNGYDILVNQIKLKNNNNWGIGGLDAYHGSSDYFLYRFTPHEDSTYQYVAQCSNRGTCDTTSGTCECFDGYTGETCSSQSLVTC